MTTDAKQPVRAPGEVSTERVTKALAMAAGDVLQRSKLDPAKRMELAGKMTQLAADFEAICSEAWEA